MIKRIGFGLAMWAVVYALSIPLLPLSKTQPYVFKSLVVSLAIVISAVSVLYYFKDIKANYFTESIKVAVTWAVINWLMDIVALLPFTRQTLPQYFLEIGIEYLAQMTPVIVLGYLLQHVVKQH